MFHISGKMKTRITKKFLQILDIDSGGSLIGWSPDLDSGYEYRYFIVTNLASRHYL
jgi:hypothetical protein